MQKIFIRQSNIIGFKSFAEILLIPILISFIAFYGCFIGSASIVYFAVLVASLYLLFCRRYVLLSSMLLFSFFSYMFQAGSFMLYEFISLIFIMRVAVTNRKRIITTLFLIPIYLITHLLTSHLSLSNIIPMINIMCLFYACEIYKPSMYYQCLSVFIIGFIISSILGFLKPLSPNMMMLLEEDTAVGINEVVTRFAGITYDPNFYTVLCVISITLLLFDKTFNSWKISLLVLMIVTLGALTVSKSFILSLAIILILSVLTKQRVKSFKLLILVSIASLCLSAIVSSIITNISLRFQDINTFDELTTGRNELWEYYWSHIFDTFETALFGHGVDNMTNMTAAHNTYIELLYNFGLIGCVVDVIYLTSCFNRINKRWISVLNLGLLGLIFILFFNLSAYSFLSLWACLFAVFIFINHHSDFTPLKIIIQ